MKFIKTIRFDPSDSHVFEHAADADEWAIAGGFSFAGSNEGSLDGKARQAFANGFLSLHSFGYSTFVSVAEIKGQEIGVLADRLAQHLVERHGAPSHGEAKVAADGEIAFILDLCADIPINSVFTLRRFFDEKGAIKEEFRIVKPPSEKLHARVWDIVDD